MTLDPSKFHKLNVTDTCSVWNVLSSVVLLNAAKNTNCTFCCTAFVQYECLDKPRKTYRQEDVELQARLKREQAQGQFSVYHIDIDDLLDVEVLQSRMNLGKGELSSIAFARRTNQGFLTDDKKARRLAETSLPLDKVQTTPLLLGWMLYNQVITDADKDKVIEEHNRFGRPLAEYFQTMYLRALELRLMKVHG